MPLAEKLTQDMTAAMRAGEKTKLSTLRMLVSALKYAQIEKGSEKGHELEDGDVFDVIRKGVKQRHDSIEQYTKGAREDLAAKEREELAILESYLPQGLSEAEMRAAIAAIVAEKGFSSRKDMGALMKEIMVRHRGVIDGKKAQALAQELLP